LLHYVAMFSAMGTDEEQGVSRGHSTLSWYHSREGLN